jgi:hypothetical protein
LKKGVKTERGGLKLTKKKKREREKERKNFCDIRNCNFVYSFIRIRIMAEDVFVLIPFISDGI